VNDFGGTTVLKMIAKSVDGSVISLDQPHADAIESLRQYSYLYTLDMGQRSNHGSIITIQQQQQNITTTKKRSTTVEV